MKPYFVMNICSFYRKHFPLALYDYDWMYPHKCHRQSLILWTSLKSGRCICWAGLNPLFNCEEAMQCVSATIVHTEDMPNTSITGNFVP